MKNSVTERKVGRIATKDNVEDITKLPKFQLIEMLDRQNKLLNNRIALAKLPDKGEKVKKIKKQIEDELNRRASRSDLSEVMAGLTLSVPEVNALEWTKDLDQLKNKIFNEQLSETEENPFKILATHSGTVFSNKTVRIEEKPQPLITEKDIEEIYAMRLSNKIDKVECCTRFLPHRTLNRSYPSKNSSPMYKEENLCSALEPPSKFGSTKSVSLETSMKLQYEHAQHLKEVQVKHAAERLKDKTYTIGNMLPIREKLQAYRDPALINSDSDYEGEEEEVHEVEDECADEDTGGIVTFQVTE